MPGKKHRPNEETREAVARKSAARLPIDSIAADLGIAVPTLERLYANELANGAAIMEGRIRENLLRQASTADS